MALVDNLDLEGLAIANAYWRVGAFEWNTNQSGIIRLRIDGYASQEAYQLGHTALRSLNQELQIDPTDPTSPITNLFGQIRKVCYLELKDMPEFKGATDA